MLPNDPKALLVAFLAIGIIVLLWVVVDLALDWLQDR